MPSRLLTFGNSTVEILQDGSLIVDEEFIPNKVFILQLPQDAIIVTVSFVVLLALRHLLTAFIFKRMGKAAKLSGSALARFCENYWYAVYYVVQLAVGLYILADRPWMPWRDMKLTINEWPHHTRDDTTAIRLYYLCQMGYYIQGIFGLVFIDERMKDFYQMLLHHILTIMLIFVSITCGYHRSGTVLFLLHDVGDVFLFVGKTLHQAGRQRLSNVCFAGFILSLVVLRLGLLPYFIYIIFTAKEVYRHPGYHFLYGWDETAFWPVEITSYSTCVFRWCFTNYVFFGITLVGLVLLHIFWFYLTMVLLVKTIKNNGNVPGDLREDDFDDKSELKKEEQSNKYQDFTEKEQRKVEQEFLEKCEELAIRYAQDGDSTSLLVSNAMANHTHVAQRLFGRDVVDSVLTKRKSMKTPK